MDYLEAKEFIESARDYGSILGLETMLSLLNGLDNPQNELKFVHIGGTNGKGSTAAFTATILGMENYKVGRYISPSILSYEEMIQVTEKVHGQVCHNYITKEEVATHLTRIETVCKDMLSKNKQHPTVFEIETALSFLHFIEKKCDLVVLEVGLGGRLDATNVVSTVLCSAITSISMDHMNYLGDTLEKIAFEKAGIIKKLVPVVSYNQKEVVSNVLRKACLVTQSSYKEIDSTLIQVKENSMNSTIFHYGPYHELEIGLKGSHQIHNSILSIMIIEELKSKGYHVSLDAIRKGLKETQWIGRFHVIKRNPYFIVDGAHNEDAARVLVKNMEQYFPKKNIIYILGVLKDKDYKKIVDITLPLAHRVITVTPNNNRGLDKDLLLDYILEKKKEAESATSIFEAVKKGKEYAKEEDVIIAFGSLSFLNEIYKIELGRNYD